MFFSVVGRVQNDGRVATITNFLPVDNTTLDQIMPIPKSITVTHPNDFYLL
jgi:hypothetical protein